jgi:hypothetical protein
VHGTDGRSQANDAAQGTTSIRRCSGVLPTILASRAMMIAGRSHRVTAGSVF